MRVTGSPTEDAMEKINMVHRRAYGYDPMTSSEVDFKLKDYSTSEKFLELILKERMYEQFNEGKRWFDLIRLGIVKEQIKSEIMQKKQQEAYTAKVEALKKKYMA